MTSVATAGPAGPGAARHLLRPHRAPCAVLQSRCYDSLAHEVFNGPEQAGVLADLTAGLSTMLRAAA